MNGLLRAVGLAAKRHRAPIGRRRHLLAKKHSSLLSRCRCDTSFFFGGKHSSIPYELHTLHITHTPSHRAHPQTDCHRAPTTKATAHAPAHIQHNAQHATRPHTRGYKSTETPGACNAVGGPYGEKGRLSPRATRGDVRVRRRGPATGLAVAGLGHGKPTHRPVVNIEQGDELRCDHGREASHATRSREERSPRSASAPRARSCAGE